MELNIWWALGFLAAGAMIDRMFARREWQKYYEGRDERRVYMEEQKTRPAFTVIQGRKRPA